MIKVLLVGGVEVTISDSDAAAVRDLAKSQMSALVSCTGSVNGRNCKVDINPRFVVLMAKE